MKDKLEILTQHRLFPLLIYTAIIATCINFLQHGVFEPVTYPSVDFRLYYDWITHHNPPPTPDTFQAPFVSIPYSPLWGIFLLPFSLFAFSVSKQLWYLCNLAVVIWFIYKSVVWIKEYNTFPNKLFLHILVPTVLFLNYLPIISNLRVGQANLIALLFITLSILCYTNDKKVYCGLFLALAISTKITPVFLILYWLLKKEYRVVLSTIISFFLLWLISIPLEGLQLQKDYLHWLVTYPYHIFNQAQVITNNMSIYAWLTDATQSLSLNPIVTTILFIGVSLLFLIVWYRQITHSKKQEKRHVLLEYGWSVALIPLITHYTEDHHLINLCLLYSSILLFTNMDLPIGFWISTGISWLLINGTFIFSDLMLFPSNYFIFRYFNMYGALMAWICGWILLKHSPMQEETPID